MLFERLLFFSLSRIMFCIVIAEAFTTSAKAEIIPYGKKFYAQMLHQKIADEILRG